MIYYSKIDLIFQLRYLRKSVLKSVKICKTLLLEIISHRLTLITTQIFTE